MRVSVKKILLQYLFYLIISIVLYFFLNKDVPKDERISGQNKVELLFVYDHLLNTCNNAFLVEDSLELEKLKMYYAVFNDSIFVEPTINFHMKVVDRNEKVMVLEYLEPDSSYVKIKAMCLNSTYMIVGYTIRGVIHNSKCD